jgi:hypothetical protein
VTPYQIKELWDKGQPFVLRRKPPRPSTRKFNYNSIKQNPDIIVAMAFKIRFQKTEKFNCNSMYK